MNNSKSNFMSYSDFLEKSQRPAIKPRIWKGKDINEYLYESDSGASLSEGRSAVSLINEDTGDAYSISPNINALVQKMEPGERSDPHRHSNMAIFIVFEGQGYSIVEGEKFEWEKGDVFFAPAWLAHEHCNTSDDEDAILYTIQDVPTVSGMGSWFLEEPVGSGATHIISGVSESDVIPGKK